MLDRPVPVDDVWSLPGREARRIIDLDAIATNVRILRSSLSTGTELMAVVKANGYGHGDVWIAEEALKNGATALGVATIEEAIRLRQHDISAPILCLGATNSTEMSVARDHNVAVTVGSSATLADAISAGSTSGNTPLKVHIDVNTGMNRYGVAPGRLPEVFEALEHSNIEIAGVFTHFARSDDIDFHWAQAQLNQFDKSIRLLRKLGHNPGMLHSANSAAILRSRVSDYDLVRVGIAMYGVRPSRHVDLLPGMRQAMTIVARTQRAATLAAGDCVGYGGTFESDHETRVGLLPLGYADGVPRSLSNRGWVARNGQKYAIAGRVSMDQLSITAAAGQELGERQEYTVLGDGTDSTPDIESMAELAGTIPYEILTSFGMRLPVAYTKSGNIVAYNNIA